MLTLMWRLLSKHLGARAALALGLLLGLSAPAWSASVAVSVSNGQVQASPEGLVMAPADETLVFTLGTKGYVFANTGAVVITGTGATFSCKTASGAKSVTCRRTGPGNNTQQSYQIKVVVSGSSTPLPTPDVWIQVE